MHAFPTSLVPHPQEAVLDSILACSLLITEQVGNSSRDNEYLDLLKPIREDVMNLRSAGSKSQHDSLDETGASNFAPELVSVKYESAIVLAVRTGLAESSVHHAFTCPGGGRRPPYMPIRPLMTGWPPSVCSRSAWINACEATAHPRAFMPCVEPEMFGVERPAIRPGEAFLPL